MARIQIKDLPKDMKISKDIMKQIRGGAVKRIGNVARIVSPDMFTREEGGGGNSLLRFNIK
jgi:hypothetical protein